MAISEDHCLLAPNLERATRDRRGKPLISYDHVAAVRQSPGKYKAWLTWSPPTEVSTDKRDLTAVIVSPTLEGYIGEGTTLSNNEGYFLGSLKLWPGRYITDHPKDLNSLATYLGRFPEGSIKNLVLIGHGTQHPTSEAKRIAWAADNHTSVRGAGNPLNGLLMSKGNYFNLESLEKNPTAVAAIRRVMAKNGTIQFQACNLASSMDGEKHLRSIGALLGCNVWGYADYCRSPRGANDPEWYKADLPK